MKRMINNLQPLNNINNVNNGLIITLEENTNNVNDLRIVKIETKDTESIVCSHSYNVNSAIVDVFNTINDEKVDGMLSIYDSETYGIDID